jgi:hypothetical protein
MPQASGYTVLRWREMCIERSVSFLPCRYCIFHFDIACSARPIILLLIPLGGFMSFGILKVNCGVLTRGEQMSLAYYFTGRLYGLDDTNVYDFHALVQIGLGFQDYQVMSSTIQIFSF